MRLVKRTKGLKEQQVIILPAHIVQDAMHTLLQCLRTTDKDQFFTITLTLPNFLLQQLLPHATFEAFPIPIGLREGV